MDSRGDIHHLAEDIFQDGRTRGGGAPVRADGAAIQAKLGPLVPIPPEMLAALTNAPRPVRRAWYAEARRRIKKAKKTGAQVSLPSVLGAAAPPQGEPPAPPETPGSVKP